MKAIITVPEPCNENWDAMQPNKQGRHCDLCALTVVDFTDWELPDIAQYLSRHLGQKVCGRFQRKQLNQPFDLKVFAPEVVSWHTYSSRKIAALIVVCFALATTSCNNNIQTSGEPLTNIPEGSMEDSTKADTLQIMGESSKISPAVKDSIDIIPQAKNKKRKTTNNVQGVLPDHDIILGGAFDASGNDLFEPGPPVKPAPAFQPSIGPEEYDSTKAE